MVAFPSRKNPPVVLMTVARYPCRKRVSIKALESSRLTMLRISFMISNPSHECVIPPARVLPPAS
jgi:hypothetical protein